MSDGEDFDRLRQRRVDYCKGRRDGYYEGRLDGYPIGVLVTSSAALLHLLRLELIIVGVILVGAVWFRLGVHGYRW